VYNSAVMMKTMNQQSCC